MGAVTEDAFKTLAANTAWAISGNQHTQRMVTEALMALRTHADRSLVLAKRWRDRLVAMRERITTLEHRVAVLQDAMLIGSWTPTKHQNELLGQLLRLHGFVQDQDGTWYETDSAPKGS